MPVTPNKQKNVETNTLAVAETKKVHVGRKKGTPNKKADDNKYIKLLKAYINSLEDINDLTLTKLASLCDCSSVADYIKMAKIKKGYFLKALLLVGEKAEKALFTKNYNGGVFVLKQLGWQDTQKIEQETKTASVSVEIKASLSDVINALDVSSKDVF